jgi:GNAT superfamily N-acetyltransferase
MSLSEALPLGNCPVRLAGGEALIVRAVGPHDANQLQDYVRGLSGESRRNRFLGALSELTPTRLDGLVHMHQPRETLLLALACCGGRSQIIAEGMLVTAPNSGRGEIALSVADRWQRRGIGTLLLRELEARARAVGARYLFGDVLHTNTAMKCFARKSGYALSNLASDARLVEIVKDLLPRREHSGARPRQNASAGIEIVNENNHAALC